MFGITIERCKPSEGPKPLTGYWVERLTAIPGVTRIACHIFNESGGHMTQHFIRTSDEFDAAGGGMLPSPLLKGL
jgi:hypothetical protein